MKMIRKNAAWIPEGSYGVCLWEMPEGGFLASEPGVFLAIEGIVGNRAVEEKLRKEAEYWIGGDTGGKPHWLPGHRKVTNNEYDDQVERLMDGHIPDWEEAIRLAEKQKRK